MFDETLSQRWSELAPTLELVHAPTRSGADERTALRPFQTSVSLRRQHDTLCLFRMRARGATFPSYFFLQAYRNPSLPSIFFLLLTCETGTLLLFLGQFSFPLSVRENGAIRHTCCGRCHAEPLCYPFFFSWNPIPSLPSLFLFVVFSSLVRVPTKRPHPLGLPLQSRVPNP